MATECRRASTLRCPARCGDRAAARELAGAAERPEGRRRVSRRRASATREMKQLTIITGMSGAGRSTAADVFEDLGWFVIDNMPPALITRVADLEDSKGSAELVALVVDVRAGEFLSDLAAARARVREPGGVTCVLFLDAADDVLVRRYEESRRKHPMAVVERVSEGIAAERALLGELKGDADVVIDTTDLNVHELRARLVDRFADAASREGALQTSVVS